MYPFVRKICVCGNLLSCTPMISRSASEKRYCHVQTSGFICTLPGSSTARDSGCNVDACNQESDIPLRLRVLISSSCGVSSIIVFVVSLTLFVFCGQSAPPSCLFPRLATSHMSIMLFDTPFCCASGGAGGGATVRLSLNHFLMMTVMMMMMMMMIFMMMMRRHLTGMASCR